MGRQKKWTVSSVNDLLRKIVRWKSSSDQGRKHFSESVMMSVTLSKAGKTSVNFIDNTTKKPRQMQVTTAKLCCSDVFSRRFVRFSLLADTVRLINSHIIIISCFNRTARRLIERSQLSSSCSVPWRISSNRLYGHPTART